MVDRWSRLVALFVPLFLFLFVPTLQQQQQPLVSWDERLALLQLRSSLGLRSKEWHVKSNPCLNWVGIHCTNGSVTGINISGFRRTRQGSESPQFSVDSLRNLTLLSTFNASNFDLPGSIPDWFGFQLPALQVLDLRSCSITGVIPALGNSSSLVELYLSDNSLTGSVPSSLGQLFGLSVLDLSRNRLTGFIPPSFASLQNLTLLDMSSNFLVGPIPSGIGNLSALLFLNLSGNSLSSIPDELGDLSILVELDLGSNGLSGSVPPRLGGLRSLLRMVLRNNLLTGPLPATLFNSTNQLQYVDLSHNGFEGAIPATLWWLPSLQMLDVSSNNFTGLLPNVSSISDITDATANISHNLLYGGLTPIIGRFRFIDLSGNYLEGLVPINARGRISAAGNCLQKLTIQKTRADCATFYADRNLVFDNFGENNGTQPSTKSKNNRQTVIILASVIGGVGLIALLLLILLVLVLCKRRTGTTNQVSRDLEPAAAAAAAAGSPRNTGVSALNLLALGDSFTYQQILQATNEFNDAYLIKHGHSGDLFYGKLEGGIPVVIKKIDLNSAGRKESYTLELELYSKASHPRLVPLLGHCLENDNEKFLVYKHMPNEDLSSALFKKSNSDDDSLQSLDWITRLKIATGAAEALSYLHHECCPPLVHRDVQSSSILLDDKYEVRLGSLSEVCPQESESHQNRISRLLRLPQSSDQGASGTPVATCAYDVYCFGKVLLELVTGKLGISSSTDAAIKELLEATLPNISVNEKELVTNIVDPSLIIDEDLLEEVWAMAIVARSCLNPKPSRRPLMRYILKALENPLKVVREEQPSARLRTTSSRGSWNAALFGSWRHSSSDVAGTSHKVEGAGSFKHTATSGSQGSGGGHNGGDGNGGNGNGNSSSTRRQSKEIFPEPLADPDIERGREH